MGYIMRNGIPYGAGIQPLTIVSKLLAGATTVTFTDDAISDNIRINLYPWNKIITPIDMSISNHTLTVTYPAQSEDVDIKLVINENTNTDQILVASVNGQNGAVILYTWSSIVSGVTGDTSVTIQDSNIHTTSILEPFMQSASNKQFAPLTTTITEGQVVYTFDALTEATDFRVKITNI